MNAQLPGELAYVFLVSIFDAVLISWIALIWYRRSINRLMRLHGPAPVPEHAEDPITSLPGTGAGVPLSPTLSFALYDHTSSREDAVTTEPLATHKRVVIAYATGVALFSAIVTWFQLGDERAARPFAAWFGTWWINAWPLVPTLAILLVRDRFGSARLALQYVVAAAVSVALATFLLQVARGSFNTAPLTNAFWIVVGMAYTAWAPLLLLWLIRWRRTRAAVPVALAGTLVFGFGSFAFRNLMIRAFDLPAFRSGLLEMSALTSTQVAWYGLFMLASLPVGWAAWRLLRWLGAAFERKRFSDVQLMVDCWWVAVTADVVVTSLAQSYGSAAVLIGVAAFAAYRIPVAVALRMPSRAAAPPPAERLLLLRVFGYDARTESLFDRVAQQWRLHGPVQLIAASDLAARTTDPADLLAFLSGRLGEHYVARTSEIAPRIEQLDYTRDPDGRHRVNELYCHDDTWRPVLQALLDVSDRVLMDLRSFSARNSGCVYELQQLLRRVPTERIVLACDDTTDLALLGTTLSEAWAAARADGAARGQGQLTLFRMKTGARRELAMLMQRLMGVPGAHRVLRPDDLPAALA